MSKVFVFRVRCDEEYIKKELKEGRLRQGWGWLKTDLTNAQKDEWVKTQCEKDPFDGNEKYYKTKFNNLSKMLDIEEGDILIIPKTSTSSQFTICKAAGKYKFDTVGGYEDGDDFRHVIPIHKESIREFNYHANEYCENIRAKMRAYQHPVNNVWNERIQEIAQKLLVEDFSRNETPLASIVESIKSDCFKSEETLTRLRDLGNRNTERITQLIFEKLGYELIKPNSYDGNGGDADLIFSDVSLSEFYEVASNSAEIARKIYVQIKNKNGEDNDDIHGVKQLITRTSTEEETNSVKILISTADKFSEKCKKLANENNVLLIDGLGFLKLVFKYLN